MARPSKNTVDYFPFYCEEGKKMFYLEETYGNDGFATFVKLLRELAKTEYHYLDLSNKTTKMFLSAKCRVPKEILESIIKDLVELGKFDAELWNENSIIWCESFIEGISDAYKKRSNKCIDRNSLLTLLDSLGVRKLSKSRNKPPKGSSKGGENPQTKVKKTKEEETKEEEEIKTPRFNFRKTMIENNFEESLVNDYMDIRKKAKLVNSERAFKTLFTKMEATKINRNKVLALIVEKQWKSFETEWATNYFKPKKVVPFDNSPQSPANLKQFKPYE